MLLYIAMKQRNIAMRALDRMCGARPLDRLPQYRIQQQLMSAVEAGRTSRAHSDEPNGWQSYDLWPNEQASLRATVERRREVVTTVFPWLGANGYSPVELTMTRTPNDLTVSIGNHYQHPNHFKTYSYAEGTLNQIKPAVWDYLAAIAGVAQNVNAQQAPGADPSPQE